jgi:hypothetical protein
MTARGRLAALLGGWVLGAVLSVVTMPLMRPVFEWLVR